MHFRIASNADAAAITALINLAFQVEKFFVATDRITLPEVQAAMARGAFLLADDQDGIAASIYVEQREDRGYFGLLSVDPSRQRSGLGSRLVAAAEDHCRAHGCRFMDLTVVNLREELPPYYRRLGYVESGTAAFPEHEPTLRPCHFIKMSKALE